MCKDLKYGARWKLGCRVGFHCLGYLLTSVQEADGSKAGPGWGPPALRFKTSWDLRA